MKPYPNYKDSGVEWLGEVSEGWDVARIRNICSIFGRIGFRGYTVGDIVPEGEGAISLSPSNINNQKISLEQCTFISWDKYYESPEIQVFNNDIVLVKTGSTIGKVAVVIADHQRMTINPQLIVLKNIKINSFFLYYAISSRYIQACFDVETAGGSTPAISQEKISNFRLVAPPLPEQTAIANYLDRKTAEIDSLIANKERLIELYEEEKAAVINQAVTKGLDPDAPMKPSGIYWLGDIPEHWEVKRLKYALDFHDSRRIPLSSEVRGKMLVKEYDYYGASGIIDQVEDYIFDGEYILLGEDGANLLTRSTGLAFKAVGKFWVNNHAHILTPKEGNIDYFVNLLENIDYTIWVSGSAQPKLTAEALGNVKIVFPDPDEQTAIVRHIETQCSRLDAIIDKFKKQIELLKEYRTTLISEVVTGKIDVRDEVVQ
ncbi:MAG: restriction endonuclease subunit S [Desulfobulbaceae bacterium]|nr:restriction endonuclease subunit S [Desulfobulbaceae bacterium]